MSYPARSYNKEVGNWNAVSSIAYFSANSYPDSSTCIYSAYSFTYLPLLNSIVCPVSLLYYYSCNTLNTNAL
jgi:hypothetical protein